MEDNVAPPGGGGKPDLAHVPQELKDRAQWVLHKTVDGKDKVPHQPDGSKASTSNSNTWSTFLARSPL